MEFFSKEFHNLNDLFIHDLQDIYDGEKRICDALPKMERAATSPELKDAFREHCQVTENQIKRLEEVFRLVGKEPESVTCYGVKGLVTEGDSICSAKGDDMVRDAGLIEAAQKLEHYEIASYGTLRTWAQELGFVEARDLLDQTLKEEEATDRKLTQIAESSINVMARH